MVVVVMAATVFEPLATGVTEPTFWSIVRDAAFDVVQASVGAPPPTNDAVVVVRVQVGAVDGCVMVTTTVQGLLATPAAVLAVPV